MTTEEVGVVVTLLYTHTSISIRFQCYFLDQGKIKMNLNIVRDNFIFGFYFKVYLSYSKLKISLHIYSIPPHLSYSKLKI